MLETKRVHAPRIGPPGKIVLVDFWDYTCVNCLRTLPYLREWDRRYREKGVAILGVHTPEFAFAHDLANVQRAVADFDLDYPVLLDNDRRIWSSFANRCWPSTYLIDTEGYIRFRHEGEGNYRETEEAIQELLRETTPGVSLPNLLEDPPTPAGVCDLLTPELYLGRDVPSRPEIRLSGPWNMLDDSAETTAADSRITLDYSAAEVNAVMTGAGAVRLFEHSLALHHQFRGEDVLEAADGGTFLTVSAPRMYRLVKHKRLVRATLDLTFGGNIRVYVFSFGR